MSVLRFCHLGQLREFSVWADRPETLPLLLNRGVQMRKQNHNENLNYGATSNTRKETVGKLIKSISIVYIKTKIRISVVSCRKYSNKKTILYNVS